MTFPKLTPREATLDAFRRWGYLQAQLDPLGQYLQPIAMPELDIDNEFAADARRVYCGTIGAEFMHIPDRARRAWLAGKLEGDAPAVNQQRILERLARADLFEQVIQSRYLGTKRFSLEGVTALIPFLDELLSRAAELGAQRSIMGMSHRGRLNVMVNTLGKSPVDIFAKFEDVDPRSILGGGDVKYHVGATGEFPARNGIDGGAASGVESQPSGGGRPGGDGPRARLAGSLWSGRRGACAAGGDPRRRGFRRPGHLGGNDEHGRHRRLLGGRRHSHRRE